MINNNYASYVGMYVGPMWVLELIRPFQMGPAHVDLRTCDSTIKDWACVDCERSRGGSHNTALVRMFKESATILRVQQL